MSGSRKPKNNVNRIRLSKKLVASARQGNIESAKKLIAMGADANEAVDEEYSGCSQSRCTNKNQHEMSLEVLIRVGADVNKCESSSHRNVPLLCAMCKGNRKCIDLLVKARVCVNIVDNYGYSPLLLSAKNGHASSVKLLIAAGADVETVYTTVDIWNETALIIAAGNRHPECVAALIKAGAYVNAVNFWNTTALIKTLDGDFVWKPDQAAKATECASLLIEAKADIYRHDDIGQTALSLAVQNEFEDIVDLIRRIEADKDKGDNQCVKQEMCLKIMCRDFIRSHLLSVSPTNLFYKVERLKSILPNLVCDFLLSRNSLEYEEPDSC